MKQNIYDNPKFFNAYMELRANERGFNSAIEEPAVCGLLPRLDGLRVLDLGCGFGKFASFCLRQGAESVLGIDISRNMISEAQKRVKDPRARFMVAPVEAFDTDPASFDVVVSSMCFHYISDIRAVFEKVASTLKGRGLFIFSVEHPICTSLLRGWCGTKEAPKKHWPVDDYKKEDKRVSTWFVDGVVKYHRTIATYVNELLDAGFSITRLLEPGPTADALAERPELCDHLRRPPILVLAGTKHF